MKRYLLFLLPLLFFLLTIISGCGSSSDASNGSDDDGDKTSQGVQAIQITIRENGSPGNEDGTYTSGVISMACNTGEVLTGVNCSCNHTDCDSSTTNFGWRVSCRAVATSVIGWCGSGLNEAEVQKDGPPITVQAMCMKITTDSASASVDIQSSYTDKIQFLSEEDESLIMKIEEDSLQYEQLLEEKRLKKDS